MNNEGDNMDQRERVSENMENIKEEGIRDSRGGGGDVHVPRSHIDKINVTSSASYIVWTKSSSKIKRVNETFKAWSDF